MESEVIKYVLEQSSALIMFLLGAYLGHWFTKKVLSDSLQAMKDEIARLHVVLDESEKMCTEKLFELQKRVNQLEDSRAFILQNALRSKD